MRLAIITDVQGNAVALEAVLKQVHTEQPDHIVCLGDVATGPAPVTVLDMLREHDIVCVRGNMDDMILNPLSPVGEDDTLRRYAEIDQWCSEQLSQRDRDEIASWPVHHAIDLSSEVRCVCCHGSPRSNEDVIEATTPESQLADLLVGVEAQLVLTGHMHTPMLRSFRDVQLINPGSVGLPFGGKRTMPTRAEYAIIDCAGRDIDVTFRAVAYDSMLFRRRLLASRMPHAEWYLSKWLL